MLTSAASEWVRANDNECVIRTSLMLRPQHRQTKKVVRGEEQSEGEQGIGDGCTIAAATSDEQLDACGSAAGVGEEFALLTSDIKGGLESGL